MINVLVTGVGALLGQGIIKALKDTKLKYRLIGTDYFAHAAGLYWVDKGYILPDILDYRIKDEEWLKKVIKIIKNNNIEIVLIGLDFEVPLFAKYKRNIEEATNVKIVVSSEKVVNICKDKWETVNFLKENKFYYPESCLPENIGTFISENNFPLIVKPRFGSTSKNLFKVNNVKELNYALDKCEKPIIQEYIGNIDDEYTCGNVYMFDMLLTNIALRRILKNGNTYQAFSDEYTEIENYIGRVTNCLKPFGPSNIQLRLTKGKPIIFEINPRFSGTTPVRSIFGINEVEAVINGVLYGITPDKQEKKKGVVIKYYESQFISWEKYNLYG